MPRKKTQNQIEKEEKNRIRFGEKDKRSLRQEFGEEQSESRQRRIRNGGRSATKTKP